MIADVRDYHLALDKILTAPLDLRERDFAVLRAFNPADEVRGREAQRQAQLALVTQAIDQARPEPVTSRLRPDAIARGIVEAVRPLHVRLKALEGARASAAGVLGEFRQRLELVEAHARAQASTINDLLDSNKALGQLVVDIHRGSPSLDLTRVTRH
jgi:hypothetical protein